MRAIVLAVLGVGLAVPAGARADDAPQSADPAPAVAAEPAVAPASRVNEPPEPTAPPPTPASKAPDEAKSSPRAEPEERSSVEEDMDFEPRLRSGFSASYGGFVPGPVHMFGLEGRAGFQISDLMCVYNATGAMVGFHSDYVTSDEDLSFERTFGGLLFTAFFFEVTFVDSISLAVGPQLAWGALVHEEAALGADDAQANARVSVFYGLLPGLRARLGLGFGSDEHARREQFTFGFDAHLFFGSPFGADRPTNEKKTPWIVKLFSTHPPIEDRIKALQGMPK